MHMTYLMREIIVKLFFTLFILFIYIVLLHIPVLPMEMIAPINEELSFLELKNIIYGTKKYSILGLNFMPIITMLSIRRIIPLFKLFYPKLSISRYNTDLNAGYWNSRFYLYLTTISVIEGILFISFVVKGHGYTPVGIVLNHVIYYTYYLIVIVVGSFIVYFFANMINIYGIGQGIYCISFINSIVVLYNIVTKFLFKYNVLVIFVIIIQCLCCLFLYYIYDTYTYRLNVAGTRDSKTNYVTDKASNYYYVRVTMGIVPIVLSHTFASLFMSGVVNYKLITINYIVQFLLFILFFLLFCRIMGGVAKTMVYRMRLNKILVTNVQYYEHVLLLVSSYTNKMFFWRFCVLCGMMFVSEWLICIIPILDLIGFDLFVDHAFNFATLYYINNIYMFTFLLTTRLFLLVYDKAGLYKLKNLYKN